MYHRFCFIVVCLVAWCMPGVTQAVTVSQMSNVVDQHAPGASASHVLSLSLTSALAAGESLSFEFDQYDVTALSMADITVTVNSASSSAAYTAFTYTPLTTQSFSLLFADAIPAGAVIKIRLGEFGAGLVINPPVVDEYEYRVTSSLSGLVSVGVLEVDQEVVAVTATIKEIISPSVSGRGRDECRSGRCLFEEEVDDPVLSLSGWSHPDGVVRIIIDGAIVGEVATDNAGYFSLDIIGFAAGEVAFWMYGLDQNGLSGNLTPFRMDLIDNTINEYNGIGLAPTITASGVPGSTYLVSGWTVANGLVTLVDSAGVFLATVQADSSGSWEWPFDMSTQTTPVRITALTELAGVNSLRGLQVTLLPADQPVRVDAPTTIESVDVTSQEKSVFTPQTLCLSGDASFDGYVDLADLSAWAYWVQHSSPRFVRWDNRMEQSCLTNDGQFTLADASVISYYWHTHWSDILQYTRRGYDTL